MHVLSGHQHFRGGTAAEKRFSSDHIEGFLPNRRGRSLHYSLHRPKVDCGMAWVFCNATLEERVFAQRVYMRFASALAEAGHVVLRFDYEGDGDSEGDSGLTSTEDCVSDIACAAEFVASVVPGARLALLGLRAGALLAAAAAPLCAAHGLLLWAPVLSGKSYLDDALRANLVTQLSIHSKVVTQRQELLQSLRAGGCINLHGYDVYSTWVNSTAELDLRVALEQISCPVSLFHLVRHDGATVPAAWSSLLAPPRITAVACRSQPFWSEAKQHEEAPAGLFELSLLWASRIADFTASP